MIQLPYDKALINGVIDRIPHRDTFIHADYHPKNVMLSNDELILIDVGDSGLGHPIADLMISYSHFVYLSTFAAKHGSKFHEQTMGLDYKEISTMKPLDLMPV